MRVHMPKKKELSYIILSIKIKNITLQHYSFNSVSTTSYIYIYISFWNSKSISTSC